MDIVAARYQVARGSLNSSTRVNYLVNDFVCISIHQVAYYRSWPPMKMVVSITTPKKKKKSFRKTLVVKEVNSAKNQVYTNMKKISGNPRQLSFCGNEIIEVAKLRSELSGHQPAPCYTTITFTTNLLSPLVAETFEQLKDKAHKCKKCKETFTFEMNYLLHREVCDPEKIFICPQCKREYASAQSFYNHRRYECGKPFDHKCLYCPYMTRLKGNLKGHVLRKHPEKNSLNGKSSCFSTKGSRFDIHFRQHDINRDISKSKDGKFYASKKSFSSIGKAQDQIPEMESFYSCPLCGKSYTYCTSRDTHYEKCKLMYNSKSMDNKRLYKCPKCGKPYKNSGSIANHLRLECGKEPQFRCTLCDYTSYQKFHYQRHYSSKHNLDITESSSKSNLQGILPVTYSDQSDPNNQFFGHYSDETYNYGSGFGAESDFWNHQQHQRSELKKLHTCSRCLGKFSSSRSFWNHQRYQCGKPASNKCEKCDYRTILKYNLKRHMLTKHS
ncbi:zinc finger protein 227-like [Ctenocephalides felis]|uniref:zinc finger protein 227-like n=1 Tax=Ctenocephalides felis TaxID=7515 RepID=UPI000E6E3F99|nr:zinc finger protein 227-like [Ctenocephalides felis]